MSKSVRIALSAIVLIIAVPATAESPLNLIALSPIEQFVGEEAGPQSLALADLDDDGVLDLVTLDAETEEVVAWIGQGDGTFADRRTVGAADLPVGVAVADLTSPFETGGDVDGIPDVVVIDEINGLQIFIGRGDGTFDLPEQNFDDIEAIDIVGVIAADFDGDGRDDLGLLEAFDGVYFLCNDAGTLQACPTPVVLLDEFAFELVAFAVGDFDGGGLDVAAIDADTGEMYVIYGNGDGTFEEVVEPIEIGPVGVEPRALRAVRRDAGDLDDIFVLSVDALAVSASATLSHFMGLDGTTGFARRDYAAGDFGNALVIEDLDGDGYLDALIVSEDAIEGTASNTFLRGLPAGLGQPVSAATEEFPGARVLTSADLDENGKPDLVAVVNDGAQILVLMNESEPLPLCVGDCDGNGIITIGELIRGVNIALGSANVVTCLAMDRDGDGVISISELIAAVNNALHGCTE